MTPFAVYLYGPEWGSLPSSFEKIAADLTHFERLYFEWDGSFVWTGEDGLQRWQVDGVLYDGASGMQYVDVKGFCPKRQWRKLVEVFRGTCPLELLTVLQLPQQTRKSLLSFEQETWSNSE